MPQFCAYMHPPDWVVPWQINNTFIGISYLQTASNCSSLRRFAGLLKLQSFYRKSGQMAKPGKV